MPLKVVLRPGETMVVNGAVIGAGDRTATIFLHNRAQFLRGRDMVRAEEVDGPEAELYFAIQCRYLGTGSRMNVEDALAAARMARPDAAAVIDRVRALLTEERAYEALRLCRALFRPKS